MATGRRVLAALDQLDPGIRDTLMLLAVGGLTYDEVARALDVPVGTVRSRIFRGRRRLQELLRDDAPVRSDAPVDRSGVGPTGGSPAGPGSGSTEGSVKEGSHG